MAATAPVATPERDWRRWRRTYVEILVGLDALAMLAGALAGLQHRFGTTHVVQGGLSYLYVVLLLVPGWVAVMALSRCYDARALGMGSDEFKRVFNAAVSITALVCVVADALQHERARGFAAAALPIPALTPRLLSY